MLGLLIGASAYTLLMTLAAKKFDRYLMPALPPRRAGGWLGSRSRLASSGGRLPGPTVAYSLLAGILAVGVQLDGIAQTGPTT
ncbi:MAG: hypothetical protein R2848_01150 [Thermomicrobiales bacterium]